MKASRVLALVWAVGTAASRCHPSSSPSSSSASVSSYSASPSSSSSPPSSSISISPSSSSSSSSAAAPSQSSVCGTGLMPDSDNDLIDNPFGDWSFSSTDGATTSAFTCLSFRNGCTEVEGNLVSSIFDYTLRYSTQPATFVAGTSYRFSFYFTGTVEMPGTPLTCTVANSVGPATASFPMHMSDSGNPNIVNVDFTATSDTAVITCLAFDLAALSYYMFYGFSLAQLC